MLANLEPTLSPARLGTYLVAAGHDEQRALALYLWNAQLGEAFHLPIQAVEIALRNRINSVLVLCYGPDWWNEESFLMLAESRRIADIEEVKTRITRKGLPLVTGQIVAGLSFGFWVAMLDPRYNPALWSARLRGAFPDLPATLDRSKLQRQVRAIATFRNRISHHEPIFKDDVTREYSRCMDTLKWICSHKWEWIKPNCRVMTVHRRRP